MWPGNFTKFTLIDEDAPRHTELSKLVNKGFTPRRVEMLEKVFLEPEKLPAAVEEMLRLTTPGPELLSHLTR